MPPRTRPYAAARFALLGRGVLAPISRALPAEGRILDLGCGIGLLSSYLALTSRGRTLLGVEPNAAKVEIARRAASELDLNNQYLAGTIGSVAPTARFAAVVACDVLHHVARSGHEPLLRRLFELLQPGGALVIKEVTTRPMRKHALAFLTDLVMAGPREPFAFRHHSEWASLLGALGRQVRVERVDDGSPYAHVLLVARRS